MSLDMEPEIPRVDPAALPGVESDALLDLPLRVWAELGRTRMPAARIVAMAPGTIVDLDRAPEDPADIYINGRYFGAGRLMLVDGEWAIRIESIDEHGEEESTDDDSIDRSQHDVDEWPSDRVERIEQTSSDGSAG